jgi:mono/diheme cytochrome c family protein
MFRSRLYSYAAVIIVLVSCGDDKKPGKVWLGDEEADGGAKTSAGADGGPTEIPGDAVGATAPGDMGQPQPSGAMPAPSSTDTCVRAHSEEPVPARTNAISQDAAPQDEAVFTRDLFNKFYKHCGGCHVDGASGNFRVENFTQFAPVVGDRQDKIRMRMTSDDPAFFMPPEALGGKPWSERSDDDPVRELYDLLDLWFAAGTPTEVFYKPAAETMTHESPYLLSPELGAALTNIGNCIPNKSIVGKDTGPMSELDAMFESATELPDRLDETDLTSFDSEKLARTSVISIAPTYPLFSDNARKMRHVRVPVGKSIKFDAAKQEFEIPANTRVYKTFLKRIVDKDGQERYRKMETRLIVSRPDGPDASDGSHEINALFGSYAWNDDETEAKLVKDPLRNGKPFADRLITYFTNEGKAQAVLDTQPLQPLVALREAGVTRTYAIPGSERCKQCHLGSHNHSFILGLTPLQIARRPLGQSGVIESAGDDELGQLQRLIDYGVISGVNSAADILPLEATQGDRKPRNDNELRAQGYMVGNCSHCHNPRGYATVQNPQLRDMLRFFPDKDGGVFQFPLDRTSPRIKRGLRQDISVPYITPSLFDRETSDQDVVSHHRQYLPVNMQGEAHVQAAPWRSLIYRNVDTPFTYAEDYALFPHMPMNVPGYDCRVPRIMGDWMVSIPSRKTDPTLNERWDVDYAAGFEFTGTESPQPYTEVKPGDPNYDAAVEDAKRRLELYHHGGEDHNLFNTNYDPTKSEKTIQHARYDEYCPDTSDIVDPTVGIGSESETPRLTPDDASRLPSYVAAGIDFSKDPNLARLVIKLDGVPDRPHWVETDVTDPPGEWAPRRPDWNTILVDQRLDGLDDRQKMVVSLVQSLKADDGFRTFATSTAPFGIWQQKSGCDFSKVPKVKEFAGQARPLWLSRRVASSGVTDADRAAAEELPVYMQSPGGMVFSEICINCHGPRFDSRGRQADTLMLMTGGASRVANLREGLLGPSAMPGANRMRVYGPFADMTSTGQDWTARYVAWMGLGGTRRVIPASILSLVGTAEVMGEKRQGVLPVTDANMLTLAQQLCSQSLGVKDYGEVDFDPSTGNIIHSSKDGTSLVSTNGDAETWLKLCSFRNAPPVRIVSVVKDWSQPSSGRSFRVGLVGWYRPNTYPATEPVGNDHGEITTGIQPDNLAPWCVVGPVDDYSRSNADAYVTTERGGRPLPFCPQWWLDDAAQTYIMSAKDLEAWSLRGAINAGASVFFRLDERLRDELMGKQALPAYDRCEDLPK